MIDFFALEHITEPPRRDALYGITDGKPAATTTAGNPDQWGAIVDNKEQLSVNFVAVDHNIELRDERGNLASLCDAMLWREGWVCFVELKDRGKAWIQEAKDQLESTISLFKANHDWLRYTSREAYACNRRHGLYNYSKKEQMAAFHRQTGFRLIIANTITAR